MLSGALTRRVELLKDAIAPSGSRPLFTEQLSRSDALRFWRDHRYDDIGQRVLERMQPEAVMELDQALSQANEAAGFFAPPGDELP